MTVHKLRGSIFFFSAGHLMWIATKCHFDLRHASIIIWWVYTRSGFGFFTYRKASGSYKIVFFLFEIGKSKCRLSFFLFPGQKKTNKKFFLIFHEGKEQFLIWNWKMDPCLVFITPDDLAQRTAVQLTWRLLIALHHFFSFFFHFPFLTLDRLSITKYFHLVSAHPSDFHFFFIEFVFSFSFIGFLIRQQITFS